MTDLDLNGVATLPDGTLIQDAKGKYILKLGHMAFQEFGSIHTYATPGWDYPMRVIQKPQGEQ